MQTRPAVIYVRRRCIRRRTLRCCGLGALLVILMLCCGVEFLTSLLLSGGVVVIVNIWLRGYR